MSASCLSVRCHRFDYPASRLNVSKLCLELITCIVLSLVVVSLFYCIFVYYRLFFCGDPLWRLDCVSFYLDNLQPVSKTLFKRCGPLAAWPV